MAVTELILLTLSLSLVSAGSSLSDLHTKICRGTNYGFSHTDGVDERYEYYKNLYTNCTYVDGNLELVFLDGSQNFDMSFLKDIHEVTGYVLIVSNFVQYIPLEKLRVIRGMTRIAHDGRHYSLYVTHNYDPDSKVGLKQLGFSSLQEIFGGDVFFFDNRDLCFVNNINWTDLLPPESFVDIDRTDNDRNVTIAQKTCTEECDPSCAYENRRYCWGSGPSMCQKLSKVTRSLQCDGRCFGSNANQCCHKACAAGCTGPYDYQCLSCRDFEMDGRCVESCPREDIYDPKTFKHIPNPNVRYAYGSFCVKKCPDHLIADKGDCVRDCAPGRRNIQGKCVTCEGPCPKKCPGNPDDDESLDERNILNFIDCTIVQGNLKIMETTFKGDEYEKTVGITVDQLSVLETIKEIQGFLQIQANTDNFLSLSFLRNLEVIHGNVLISSTRRTSVQIFGTSLKSLDLESLKEVRNGNIVISNNTDLCFAENVTLLKLMRNPTQKLYNVHNSRTCAADGNVCSQQCTSDGCWGKRDDQCFSCAHFSLEKRCLESCNSVPRVFQLDNHTCARCHPECKWNCTNNESNTCGQNGCLHVQDGPYCVTECPIEKYPDENGVCQDCHPSCGEYGCTGSMNSVGPGACNSCDTVVYDNEGVNVTNCLLPSETRCPDGYYKQKLINLPVNDTLYRKEGCKKCHPECSICDEYGVSLTYCKQCVHFKQEDKCVKNCSEDYFLNTNTNECLMCDVHCLRCKGPTEADCLTCKQYFVFYDIKDREKGFNCTAKCPDHVPFRLTEEKSDGEKVTLCVESDGSQESQRTKGIIIGSTIGGVALIFFIVVLIVIVLLRRSKAEEKKMALAAKLLGACEMEPLSPSGAKPDMAVLRVIKDTELRIGTCIGSGAFGAVYKGAWIPEKENIKLFVAIKVLTEGVSSCQSKELLEEARVMASVENDYCIRILAFCMGARMMIVTQLMPYGCLLEFIHQHKNNISSEVLLNWSMQIAKGMAYLEEKRIVHRDLAARNVLVQNSKHIRITDFGLSKIIDLNENVFLAAGGKMPIKWLALESIQHKIFTHKSDVWSYGVTLWELFTYGQKPFENIDARSIPDYLEKGERLPQPSMCTIDVYMVMIKCWLLDADTRPSFVFLVDQFSQMAKDPGRYLYIPGDRELKLPIDDPKELIRSFSKLAEGSEQIVDVNDYLQIRGFSRSLSSSGSRTERIPSTDSEKSTSGAFASVPLRRERPSCDSASPNSCSPTSPTSRVNSRYCSDPCNAAVLASQTSRGGGSSSKSPVSRNGELPPNDDYLEPRNTEVKPNYVDLIGNSDGQSPADARRPHYPPQTMFANSSGTNFVFNPQYFDGDDIQPQEPILSPKKKNYPENNYYNELICGAQPLLGDQTSTV